ncbi:MAG TPA: hypothetical protein DCY40_03535 [Actinobacteria bacterium]|nr:hypothetical protein [Actinomycetota bacterium]
MVRCRPSWSFRHPSPPWCRPARSSLSAGCRHRRRHRPRGATRGGRRRDGPWRTPDLGAVADGSNGLGLHRPGITPRATVIRHSHPGTGYHYSNPGYQVVGMVLEHVTSGLDLSVLLEQRLVIPHGLASMSLAPDDDSSPELRGLEVTATGSTDNTDDLFTFGNGGNGGLLTNADDLARFFRLLLAGEIFETIDVATMIEPSAPSMDAGVPYGLGLATYELACATFYGHSGGVNGTVSIAIADRTGDSVVVAAFNTRRETDARLLALAETLLCG